MLQEFATSGGLRVSILSGRRSVVDRPSVGLSSVRLPSSCDAVLRRVRLEAAACISHQLHCIVVQFAGDAHVGGVGRLYSRNKIKPIW